MDTSLIPSQPAAGQLSPHLAQKAREYIGNSKSASTLRVYAAHWRTFAAFCEHHGVQALPATAATVCAFLTTEAEEHRAATLTAKLSAIAYMHRVGKQPNPCDTAEVKEMLAGIRRTIGTAPRRKKAITPAILRKMLDALPDGLRGRRDRAILLVGWASAMRRSELAAMRVEDVTFTDYGARILIPKSKTDQEGEGQYVQLEQVDNSDLDPINALRDWLSAAGIQSGSVFRGVDMFTGRMGSEAITGRQIARIVKDAAERVGESAHEFAGHSMRAGFVTSALAAGEKLGVRRFLELVNESRRSLFSLGELDVRLRAGALDEPAALSKWGAQVHGHIERQWGDAAQRFDHVIAVGGGAILLNDTLADLFRSRLIESDEPVLSVARGLYKFGVMNANK